MVQNQPRRKHNRLIGFDYSNAASYFVTICTAHRKNLFWVSQNDRSLTAAGRIAEQEIRLLPERFRQIQIDKYVIMPDHVHMIITIGTEPGIGEKKPDLKNIVGCYKAKVTSQLHRLTNDQTAIWQKSFYDHVIRNENEYSETWEYIDYNPFKHLSVDNQPI